MSILDQLLQPLEVVKKGKSKELFDVKCIQCGNVHKYPKNQILAKIKHNELRFCSQVCQHQHLSKELIKECAFCGKTIKKKQSEVNKSKSNLFFCDCSCSAKHRNPNRTISEKQKKKTRESLLKYYAKKGHKYHVSNCLVCGKEIKSRKFLKKTCSQECYKIHQRKSGEKGGIKASTGLKAERFRSKSERLLYDKIKTIFPDAVHNQWIFDGYDADIIIPSIKVAIHWNGPWHYRVIISEKHFESIKKRDLERYQSIINADYQNYIIKDITGIFKPKNVELEFQTFLNWL